MKYGRRSRIAIRNMRRRTRKEFLSLMDNENSLYINEYSLYINRIYMLNALRTAQKDQRVREAIRDWMRRHEEQLEALDASLLEEYQRVFSRNVTKDRDKADRLEQSQQQFFDYAVKTLIEKTQQQPALSPEETATRLVVQRFSLGPVAHALLTLGCYYGCDLLTESLWDKLLDKRHHLSKNAILLGCAREEVEDALRELVNVGIADSEYLDGRAVEPSYYTNQYFFDVWNPPVRNMDELLARLVGQPCEATLQLSDFAYLEGRDEAVRLLRAVVQKRHKDISTPEVNILLVGRAGTGKTEFAKTLSQVAGTSLFSIGEPNQEDHERFDSATKAGTRRRNTMCMAQVLLRPVPNAAILCDDAEDVLDSIRGTRLMNHRLLENTPVPVIYTANRLDHLDESMLRRFSYILTFTAHSPTRQTAILQQMLEKSNIEGIDAAACARCLVDQLECPPGLLAQAIETTRLIGGGERDIYHFCERLEHTIATHSTRPRLGPPIKAKVPWEAFSHLGQDAEALRDTLAAVIKKKEKGINILLYGPPGTGKTEFARTLCGEVGTRLYAIGENEIGSQARPSVGRTETLDYALEALADEPNAAILFDEMEDFHQPQKHWLNRIVEANPVPIIWTCNSIDFYRRFRSFFIDRILYAIEFRHIPVSSRRTVYADILHQAGMPDIETKQLAEELAHKNKVTPRQVTLATKQAVLMRDHSTSATKLKLSETIKRNIDQKEKLRYGVRSPDMLPIAQYDPALIHADKDLPTLVERIVALDTRQFSLCLCGPPGTGKTAFAYYIAEQIGMDVLFKRASDLLNKYVGGTEQQIASAFAEALEKNAFLIFDEVDSLLMDRQSAQRSWEVSRVNELLSQMERHPLPFACTTNRGDSLDEASARRFLFRIQFYFLDQPRINRAFELFFNCKAPSSVLAQTKLTPADFSNVRKRAEVLGFLDDPEQISQALAEECRIKPGNNPTGF